MFKKRLVPGADAGNTMVLLAEDSGCCGGDYTQCKYRVSVDPLVNFASITIEDKGVETTLSLGGTITVAALLPAAIRAAIKGAGFVVDDTPGSTPKDVTVGVVGNAVTVEIWGEAKVLSLNLANATEVAATALCVKQVQCDYEVTVPYGGIAVSVDGGAPEGLGTPTTYAAGATAAIKTDVEDSTALADAVSVVVTEDAVLDTYTIKFGFKKADVSFEGVYATRANCYQDFVA